MKLQKMDRYDFKCSPYIFKEELLLQSSGNQTFKSMSVNEPLLASLISDKNSEGQILFLEFNCNSIIASNSIMFTSVTNQISFKFCVY